MDGWQRAFVLHARPYSETSLLLDFFTEHQGRVRVLANQRCAFPLLRAQRGATAFYAITGPLEQPRPGKNLRSAEPVSLGLPLSGLMLYSGLYYREEKGFTASVLLYRYSFSGQELRALAELEFSDIDTLRAAKRFTRMALKPYLGGKPLKSRELFRQFLNRRPLATPQASACEVAVRKEGLAAARTVTKASNKLVWATALVYIAIHYLQMSGKENG